MNIDEMPAGREMDLLIETEIMHNLVCTRQEAVSHTNSMLPNHKPQFDTYYTMDFYVWREHDLDPFLHPVPYYSTDIAATWEVVEHVNALSQQHGDIDGPFPLQLVKWGPLWHAAFDCEPFSDDGYWYEFADHNDLQFAARAETASLAICRAALKVHAKSQC